jgi:hypothetical protein
MWGWRCCPRWPQYQADRWLVLRVGAPALGAAALARPAISTRARASVTQRGHVAGARFQRRGQRWPLRCTGSTCTWTRMTLCRRWPGGESDTARRRPRQPDLSGEVRTFCRAAPGVSAMTHHHVGKGKLRVRVSDGIAQESFTALLRDHAANDSFRGKRSGPFTPQRSWPCPCSIRRTV